MSFSKQRLFRIAAASLTIVLGFLVATDPDPLALVDTDPFRLTPKRARAALAELYPELASAKITDGNIEGLDKDMFVVGTCDCFPSQSPRVGEPRDMSASYTYWSSRWDTRDEGGKVVRIEVTSKSGTRGGFRRAWLGRWRAVELGGQIISLA